MVSFKVGFPWHLFFLAMPWSKHCKSFWSSALISFDIPPLLPPSICFAVEFLFDSLPIALFTFCKWFVFVYVIITVFYGNYILGKKYDIILLKYKKLSFTHFEIKKKSDTSPHSVFKGKKTRQKYVLWIADLSYMKVRAPNLLSKFQYSQHCVIVLYYQYHNDRIPTSANSRWKWRGMTYSVAVLKRKKKTVYEMKAMWFSSWYVIWFRSIITASRRLHDMVTLSASLAFCEGNQTAKLPLTWDAMPFMWRHCNV